MNPKYPDIKVKLTGHDGNAFMIIGRVRKALQRGNVEKKDIDSFMNEAMSGDYNNVLTTCMKWVKIS